MDEETAKSCDSCARALWPNVLGSFEIVSSSRSMRQVRLRFTYLDVDIRTFSWITHRGRTIDQLSRLLWRRPRRTDTRISQPKSCLFGRLAGKHGGWRTTFSTGAFRLAGPQCIINVSKVEIQFWVKGGELIR
jgi:hypothetical protein